MAEKLVERLRKEADGDWGGYTEMRLLLREAADRIGELERDYKLRGDYIADLTGQILSLNTSEGRSNAVLRGRIAALEAEVGLLRTLEEAAFTIRGINIQVDAALRALDDFRKRSK